MQSAVAARDEYIGGPVIRVGSQNWLVFCRYADKQVALRFVQILADEAASHPLPNVCEMSIEIFGDESGDAILETCLLHVGERHIVGISTHTKLASLSHSRHG